MMKSCLDGALPQDWPNTPAERGINGSVCEGCCHEELYIRIEEVRNQLVEGAITFEEYLDRIFIMIVEARD